MRISDTISNGGEPIHDRLTVAEDCFEHLILVLVGREVQHLRGGVPQVREVVISSVGNAGIIQDVLADCFNECPRGRDSGDG